VLTRPNTKKADIIRGTMPGVHEHCHVYALCSTRAQADELCRLLNLGLELEVSQKMEQLSNKVMAPPKPKRKPRGRE